MFPTLHLLQKRVIVKITLVKKLIKNPAGTVIEVYEKDVEFGSEIIPPIGSYIEAAFLSTKWSRVKEVFFPTHVRSRAVDISFSVYIQLSDHDGTDPRTFPDHYKLSIQQDGWEEVDYSSTVLA